ncbi:hypothetical protein CEXT_170041 [Caerostris extrusa]|uniref:Uncharacterized protein n=1 Tax=Caerostris extrusa TaxID=172846 RepID=A0AAV4XST3_CAEEX|nr:hypothetical protein CEXT_170041 [Caerostris extrusa]
MPSVSGRKPKPPKQSASLWEVSFCAGFRSLLCTSSWDSANFAFPEVLFKVFFYLGYCNSALNPIIYGIISKDFRAAF